jgi:hypothetical protein
MFWPESIHQKAKQMRQVSCMDTAKAYGRMEEANRIIEDFPVKKYAIYTILFLVEIAICFAVILR